MKRLSFTFLVAGLGLAVSTPVQATPIQCYIGQAGSYQVCDVREVGASEYLLIWPDTDKTAIVETSTPSGSWIEVSHAHADGSVYGGGVRYPATHDEGIGGEWLCYHRQPGGIGNIDFCIKP